MSMILYMFLYPCTDDLYRQPNNKASSNFYSHIAFFPYLFYEERESVGKRCKKGNREKNSIRIGVLVDASHCV